MIRYSSFLLLLLVAGVSCLETGVDISSTNGGSVEKLRRPNYRGSANRRLGKKGSSSEEYGSQAPTFLTEDGTEAPSEEADLPTSSSSKSGKGGKGGSSPKSGKKSGKKRGKKSGKKGSEDEEKAPTVAPTTAPSTAAPSSSFFPTITALPTASDYPSMVPTLDDFDTTLDLDNVAAQFQPAFFDAAERWDTVIVADVPDIDVDQATKDDTRCDKLPDQIDDIYICATIAPNDGEGGVLGFAGPEYARFGANVLPYIGYMEFDEADVQNLVDAGTFNGVILHEMAHVYGFGTLWGNNDLLEADGCTYKTATQASAEFQKISGCPASTPVPLENDGGEGTACGHWEEDCFVDEIMTGFNTGALPISAVTIASLEDLGYVVDYDQADPFTSADLGASCKCSAIQDASVQKLGSSTMSRTDAGENKEAAKPLANTKLSSGGVTSKLPKATPPKEEEAGEENEPVTPNKIGGFKLGGVPSGTRGSKVPNVKKIGRIGGGRSSHHRQLSEGGLLKATNFGVQKLRESKAKRDNRKSTEEHRYIGDQVIIVLYIEDGTIYSVDVWRDML